MHDIRLIRDDPEAFDAAMARRGVEAVSGAILSLDGEFRAITTRLQVAQSQHKELSRKYGRMRNRSAAGDLAALLEGDPEFRDLEAKAIEGILASQLADLKQQMQTLEQQERELIAKREGALAAYPNLPDADVPDGADEAANVEVARWGTPRRFDFAAKEHADLGPPLGLDFETGALISGARFTFLRGQMARLQRGLGQFMLDRQTAAGFTECAPPLLVRGEAMFGTGQLPKFAEDSFATNLSLHDHTLLFWQLGELDKLKAKGMIDQGASLSDPNIMALIPAPPTRRWLIPTSEVSLTNSIREQILADAVLPIRMTALTPCFRSEAGSAGKDTRGYIRQHQFEKVELVTICRPEDSAAEHEKMTLAAEAILEALDLPYRRMLLCAGDMGFAARKTYDLEVWLPGQDAWREISSISDCGDFQARRMNARYRPAKNELGGQKGTQFVHTLNGSGLAVGRTLVAVLENYQQEDGSVDIPEALVSYMGGVAKLTPAA